MKLALFGRSVPDPMITRFQSFIDHVVDRQIGFTVYEPFYQQIRKRIRFAAEPGLFLRAEEISTEASFLFSFGGDGTILDSMTLIGRSGIPVVGINTGRLGFLSTISGDEILPALDDLLQNRFSLDERALLHLTFPSGLFGDFPYALNDLTIYKSDDQTMLTIKTSVDDAFLNAYWADGLIVATPTGSTAYSLSCTGPILTPNTESWVITPIASHNLTVRPLVLRDDSHIRIQVDGNGGEFFLSLDSRKVRVPSGIELEVSKAAFGIRLVRLADRHFFKTIREKLNWGRDARN